MNYKSETLGENPNKDIGYEAHNQSEDLKDLKYWYHNGYLTEAGVVRTGKSIVEECLQNPGTFKSNFSSYVQSLTHLEKERIKGFLHTNYLKIYEHLRPNSKGNIEKFLALLGEMNAEKMLENPRKSPDEKKKMTAVSRKKRVSKKVTKIVESNIQSNHLPKIIPMTQAHISTPQFGEDIPENLQLGVSQCFLKIKRCVTDIVNLQKSDVGVLQEGKKHYIVFRTESLTEKILERRYFVEEAIEVANKLSFNHPVVGKSDRHINYVLKVPTNK